jgi:hypothetical protein
VRSFSRTRCAKPGNPIELVSPTGVIHTYTFKDPNSYAETIKKMDAFFKELGLPKPD